MEAAIADGKFIEHATYAGNTYGTSFTSVEKIQNDGKVSFPVFLTPSPSPSHIPEMQHLSPTFFFLFYSSPQQICILDIEMAGVQSMKASHLNSSTCFIMVLPPSIEILEERLRGRGKTLFLYLIIMSPTYDWGIEGGRRECNCG